MKERIVLALGGNPNSGKTSLFNQLTGARAHVGNYPGVTVEKREGICRLGNREIQVIDLPGTYSLTAYSLDELVARDFIVQERPDLVVNVVDASNLERNLYLAVQFMEIGVPVVIALNMMDVAEARGLKIDVERLSALLGVPVVPTVARSRRGIDDLLAVAVRVAEEGRWQPKVIRYGPDVDDRIGRMAEIIARGTYSLDRWPARWLALKMLEGDTQIRDLLARDEATSARLSTEVEELTRHLRDTLDEDPEGIIADHRYGFVSSVTKQAVILVGNLRRNISDLIDMVALNRLLGPVLLLAVLYLIYQFVFWVGAEPVAWTEAFFGWLSQLIMEHLAEGPIRSLLTSGLIDGVGGVLGFVPLIAFMFLAIALLDDSGYLARIAFIMDRVLRTFGLHGNSFMSLMLGGGLSGGCAVPGVMAARTLRDPKERLATILVTPLMNCGAKLPVMIVLIAAFFPKYQARMMFLMTLLAWAVAFISAWFLRSTVLRGEHTPFVMELPPYRLPTLKGLLIHSWERVWQYLRKAGSIILAISILMWAMMTYPGLPDDTAQVLNYQRDRIESNLIAGPAGVFLPDQTARKRLESLLSSPQGQNHTKENQSVPSQLEPVETLARAIALLRAGKNLPNELDMYRGPAQAYEQAKAELRQIEFARTQATLKVSAAGRLGRFLEKFTRPLGFDWRVNVALTGGVAAKEVILATLGTAYSLGGDESEGPESLSRKLAAEPGWSPLVGFTLMIFVMFYSPCMPTMVVISREAGWKWAIFAMFYNTALAYALSLIVSLGGRALGLA